MDSSEELNHLLRRGGEVADGAVGVDGDHVLDPAAVFALKVDARFNGDDVAALEDGAGGRPLGKTGRLVDVESDTVAEP